MTETSRVFVDTDVLVYAFDRSEPERQALARTVLAAVRVVNPFAHGFRVDALLPPRA